MKPDSPTSNDQEIKWGYAFAGAIALGFAAVIQFVFAGLDEDSLARLPGFVKLAYGIGGKLGITVPLALLGLGLIIRDLTASRSVAKAASASTARSGKSWCARKAEENDEDLEVGEPIPGQSMPSIPVKAGPAQKQLVGAKAGARSEPEENGGMVLSSAKYLNRRID